MIRDTQPVFPFGHADDLAPDLRTILARTGTSSWGDQEELIRYLGDCPMVLPVLEATHCLICDRVTPGGSSLRTDNVWHWREDLAHYVVAHGFELPSAFTSHAEREGYHAPELSAEEMSYHKRALFVPRALMLPVGRTSLTTFEKKSVDPSDAELAAAISQAVAGRSIRVDVDGRALSVEKLRCRLTWGNGADCIAAQVQNSEEMLEVVRHFVNTGRQLSTFTWKRCV